MADLYQNKRFTDDQHRDARLQPDSDPLAELARLIGQSDPLADFGRERARDHQTPLAPERLDDEFHQEPRFEIEQATQAAASPSRPAWLQRRASLTASEPAPRDHYATHHYDAGEPPADGYPRNDRYAPGDAAGYDDHAAADPHRYDDALYGQIDTALANESLQYAPETAYQDDPYAYPGDYADDPEEAAGKPRRRLLPIAAILALAVVGTGGAYAYRSLTGAATVRGEPPVIKADTAPIKVVPPTQSAERGGKPIQERLASAGGVERLVPREEAPVDVASQAQAGPRVVFPPLTQNPAPLTVAATAPNGPAAMMTGDAGASAGPDPRRVRTVPIRSDGAPVVAARPAPAATAAHPPAAAETRTASINPATVAPPPAVTGGYFVQVSSQRSDGDARTSYKVLQGKFPSVLRSHAPVIKKVDLGSKGVYYRAMVGPFAAADEASQLCGSLKAAGGQCIVQRN